MVECSVLSEPTVACHVGPKDESPAGEAFNIWPENGTKNGFVQLNLRNASGEAIR